MNIRKSWLSGLILIGAWAGAAHAQRFDLETAIIDSTTSRALGGGKKSGEINSFFKAQKEMVYGALSDLGIPFDSLPADVRKNLERFHTTNFAAFQMFSMGLNAQDEGKFAEAKAFFEKAVELDPEFELAGKLSVSMPSSNVTGSVQLQAALAAAVKAASSSSKTQVEIDLSGAIAALQSGLTVVLGAKSTPTSDKGTAGVDNSYTSNPAGSATNYAARKVVGNAYSVQSGVTVSVASTNEWTLDQVNVDGQGLVRVGDTNAFQATRSGATSNFVNSLALSDGSTVSWGTWQAGSGNFTVSSSGSPVPNLLGSFEYMIGEATRAMPGSGAASFVPVGGFFNNVSGTIGVDFLNRKVQLNSLGFNLGSTSYSNLVGEAFYSNSVASGFFKGNYQSGACSGCTDFSPAASVFTGNFLGKNASGLMFSTVMSTGSGTASGLHAFRLAP